MFETRKHNVLGFPEPFHCQTTYMFQDTVPHPSLFLFPRHRQTRMHFEMKSILALAAAAVCVCVVVAEREPDLRIYKSFFRRNGGASSTDEQARSFHFTKPLDGLICPSVTFHDLRLATYSKCILSQNWCYAN